jgi:cbb3-type cytochrome oxidase subunit 3
MRGSILTAALVTAFSGFFFAVGYYAFAAVIRFIRRIVGR